MFPSSMQEQSQHGNNNNNNNNTTTSMTSANSINLNENGEVNNRASTGSSHAFALEIGSLTAVQLEQQQNGNKQQPTENNSLATGDEGEPKRKTSINKLTRERLRETSTSIGSINSNKMHSNEEFALETNQRKFGSGIIGSAGINNSNKSHCHRKTSSSSAKASIRNVGNNVGAATATTPSKNPYTNSNEITAAISTQQQQTTTASQRNLKSHQNSNSFKNRSSNNFKKNARGHSDDEQLSIVRDSTEETPRDRRYRSRRSGKHTAGITSLSSSASSSNSSNSSTGSSCNGSCSSDETDSSSSSGEPNLLYPGFPAVALKYLTQDTRPRNWCLMLITNPYPFLIKKKTNNFNSFH